MIPSGVFSASFLSRVICGKTGNDDITFFVRRRRRHNSRLKLFPTKKEIERQRGKQTLTSKTRENCQKNVSLFFGNGGTLGQIWQAKNKYRRRNTVSRTFSAFSVNLFSRRRWDSPIQSRRLLKITRDESAAAAMPIGRRIFFLSLFGCLSLAKVRSPPQSSKTSSYFFTVFLDLCNSNIFVHFRVTN